MKITKLTPLLIAAAVMLSGCGKVTSDTEEPGSVNTENQQVQQENEQQSETTSENTGSTETESKTVPDEDKSFVSIDLTDSDKEGVKGAGVYGYFENGSLHDLYGVHVLHTGVVGLYSPPVEFSCSGLETAKLQFNIDPDNMGAVPLGNLIMLHYDEENGSYDTVPSVTDTENYRVTSEITEDGVYMLADAYQWYKCWGADVSQYTPTPNSDSSPFEDEQHGRYDCLDYGFSMQLPDSAEQFRHAELYSCDEYELRTFSRITSDLYNALWTDISAIVPSEPMTLDELKDVFMKTRGTIYGDYPYATIRTIDRCEEITSADGVKGLRFIGSDSYYVGDELEEPYESWYDVYPCGDVFLEFHAEYLQKEGSPKVGMEHEIPSEMLASITFDK